MFTLSNIGFLNSVQHRTHTYTHVKYTDKLTANNRPFACLPRSYYRPNDSISDNPVEINTQPPETTDTFTAIIPTEMTSLHNFKNKVLDY